jgi:flagellar protein FliL
MRKLLPILLALLGLGAGIGAGYVLKPAPAMEEHAEEMPLESEEPEIPPEFVKLSNQFVIPILKDGRIASMVIMSINLEVTAGSTEAVYTLEPKLRDAFLQVLFDHANSGGFQGSFTDGANMLNLRTALREVATNVLGDMIKDILIVDIGRQDS